MTSRSSTAAPILAVLAIVLVMSGAYVGGYFWLSDYEDWGTNFSRPGPDDFMQRMYRTKTEAAIFSPAGKVEQWLRGVDVEILSVEEQKKWEQDQLEQVEKSLGLNQ